MCIGCSTSQNAADRSTVTTAPNSVQAPFSLSIVPSTSDERGGTITMAQHKPDTFYVVVTNVSQQSQALWGWWNSWGYFAISFEVATDDGRKVTLSRKRTIVFTTNVPSTFVIAAGQHQVYAVQLDKWWETQPMLRRAEEMPVKLKAVYEVSPTAESAQHKVWTGRVESKTYDFTLRQW